MACAVPTVNFGDRRVSALSRPGRLVPLRPAPDPLADPVFVELCEVLFASLPRSDQRRRGMQYIRGLLDAPGRKSIRNIATLIGGSASEQSLHHFITNSTWDWVPVRQALMRHVVRTLAPLAWVVSPIVIPKAGTHSVGVDRHFIPDLGQVVSAQQAVGVWAATDHVSWPVNWLLHLPQTWLDNPPKRSQAAIPDEEAAEPLADSAVRAFTEVARDWQVPRRPVVLDARDGNLARSLHRLAATGSRFVVRIANTTSLRLATNTLAGHRREPLPAGQIMSALRDLRRPTIPAGAADRFSGARLVAAARVRLPGAHPQAGTHPGIGELMLVGVGGQGRPWPEQLWLTDWLRASPRELLQMINLNDQVERDFVQVAERVGIRDFAGRSYHGWHRHATLASAAHAVAVLHGRAGTGRDRSALSA